MQDNHNNANSLNIEQEKQELNKIANSFSALYGFAANIKNQLADSPKKTNEYYCAEEIITRIDNIKKKNSCDRKC